MASLQTFAAAALVLVTSGGAARAVDLPPAPALPAAEASSDAFSGWYLRGDLGAGIEAAPKLDARSGAIPQGFRCRAFRPSRSPLSRTRPCPRPGRSTPASAMSSIPGCGWTRRSNIASAASFARPTRSTIPRRSAPGAVSLRRPPPRKRLVDRRAHQRLRRSRQLLGRDALRRRRNRRRRHCALRRLGPGPRFSRGERDRSRRRVLLQRLEDEFRLGADGGVRLRPRPQPEARGRATAISTSARLRSAAHIASPARKPASAARASPPRRAPRSLRTTCASASSG